MTRDEQTICRVLVQQYLDELNSLMETVLGDDAKRAASKKTAVERLKQAPGGMEQVVAAIRSRAKGATFESPGVYQHHFWVLGPLGLTKSEEKRKSGDAASLSQFLFSIAERHGDHRLAAMHEQALAGPPPRGSTGLSQRIATIQALLAVGDEALGCAINSTGEPGAVLDLEAGVATDAIADGVLPWLATRFGVMLGAGWTRSLPCPDWFSDGEVAHELGLLLAEAPSAALANEVGQPADLQAACVHLVFAIGPQDVVDRWFSDAQLWDLLSARGLQLPPLGDLSTQELHATFFQALGLQAHDAPRGWYSLLATLEAPGWQRNLDAFELFRRVEKEYAMTIAAFLAFSLGEDDASATAYLGTEKLEVVNEWLGFQGGPSLQRRTFGQKLKLVERFIDRTSEELRQEFAAVGCDAQGLQALVNAEAWTVVQMRNTIAHGDASVTATQARDAIVAWLRSAGADNLDLAFPLPMRVRHRRTETDHLGWSRVWFEDERGREERTANTEWDLQQPAYVLGRLRDAVRGLCLVRI